MYYGSIRFSPNGKQLLSFSGFGQSIFVFTVWNVLQREPLVQTFSEAVIQGGLAFSPDSQRLVSVFTRDGKNILLLWDISVSAWQSRGCAIAQRNLTQDEWKEFVKDEQQRTKVCTDFPFGS
jgi:WD40 repeat protein